MNPYADIVEFFVEAIINDFEAKWRKEREQQIIEEDNKKAAGMEPQTAIS